MKKALTLAFLYAAPLVSFAQTAPGNLSPLKSLVANVGDLLNLLIPVIIALALVVFFWGLVKYIWGGGKDSASGRKIMMAGIVSLFVMVSIWGIIRLAQSALGVDSRSGTLMSPQVQIR